MWEFIKHSCGICRFCEKQGTYNFACIQSIFVFLFLSARNQTFEILPMLHKHQHYWHGICFTQLVATCFPRQHAICNRVTRNTFCSTENVYHMQQPLSIDTRHRWSSLMAGHKSRKDDAMFHSVTLIIKLIFFPMIHKTTVIVTNKQ